MEAGIAALKAATVDMSVGHDDPVTPVVEHGGTIVTVEDGKVVVSGIPPPSSSLMLPAMVDERQYYSDSEVPCGGSSVRRRRQHATVATQTHITASDVDERCATPPGEWYSNLSSTECSSSLEGLSQSSALHSSDVTMANSSLTAISNSSNLLINGIVRPDGLMGSSEKITPPCATAEDCQFEMELSDDEGIAALSLRAKSTMFGRCASMPSINHERGFNDSTDAWAASQYMSTAMHDYDPTTRYCVC